MGWEYQGDGYFIRREFIGWVIENGFRKES